MISGRTASSFAAAVLAGVLVAGCGETTGSGTTSEPTSGATQKPASPSTETPRMGGGSLDHQGYASALELADAVDIVVLGTVASWEDGFTFVVPDREGEDTSIPYAVMTVTVDQVLKGQRLPDELLVPVRLDGDLASYEADAPVGSNVAFLGNDEMTPSIFDGSARIEEVADSLDVDALKWGAFQGVIVESESGELLNLDTYSRAPLWPEIAELPAEEQFGMLAQQLMSLQR